MQVSFKGIKNINSFLDYEDVKDKRKNLKSKRVLNISLQLDNDKNNDLDTFQKLLGKRILKDDGILNIYTYKKTYKKDDDNDIRYYLNGYEVKKYEPKNFNIFSKLYDLMTKTEELKDDEFQLTESFNTPAYQKKNDSFAYNLYTNIAKTPEEQKEVFKKSLSPDFNKICALLTQNAFLTEMYNINFFEEYMKELNNTSFDDEAEYYSPEIDKKLLN